MIAKLFRALGPIVALSAATLVAGCDGPNVNFNIGDTDAVPLSELDMSGPAPLKLVLAGPDDVIVTEGNKLAITVEGDSTARDLVRFSLDNDTLGISRKDGKWKDVGTAIVRVTMPAPTEVLLAGSGTIKSAKLAGKASVTVAGSGRIDIAEVKASALDITVAGSGQLAAGGQADSLDMTIAGSGSADMPGLSVGSADLTIAGSGNASFASDGKVDASIMGSGNITVSGKATCTVSAMGSGTVRCADGPVASPAAPAAPLAPATPDAPPAPEAPDAN